LFFSLSVRTFIHSVLIYLFNYRFFSFLLQDDGWLLGVKKSDGKKGVFPENFTKRIWNDYGTDHLKKTPRQRCHILFTKHLTFCYIINTSLYDYIIVLHWSYRIPHQIIVTDDITIIVTDNEPNDHLYCPSNVEYDE
jgi:hypothetical protein